MSVRGEAVELAGKGARRAFRTISDTVVLKGRKGASLQYQLLGRWKDIGKLPGRAGRQARRGRLVLNLGHGFKPVPRKETARLFDQYLERAHRRGHEVYLQSAVIPGKYDVRPGDLPEAFFRKRGFSPGPAGFWSRIPPGGPKALSKRKVPRRLYHGTSGVYLAGMLKKGKGQLPAGTHFTPSLAFARIYAENRAALPKNVVSGALTLGHRGGDPIIVSIPYRRIRKSKLTVDSDVPWRPQSGPHLPGPLKSPLTAHVQAQKVRQMRAGREVKNWRVTARYLAALRSRHPVPITKADIRRVGRGIGSSTRGKGTGPILTLHKMRRRAHA